MADNLHTETVHADTVLEYKCPCCGGKIEFDSSIQKMKCPFCDTEFEMDTLKNYDAVLNDQTPTQMEWDRAQSAHWNEDETKNMLIFSCHSCGGEIICDKTTAATHCPFCGNPVVMMGHFAGDLRPDLIIPFKLDKEAAVAAFKNHLKGKALLPKAFSKDSHIEEIKGVYVPFWLFDGTVDADMRFQGTRVNSVTTGREIITTTEYYRVRRSGVVSFDKIPADASSKMPDAHMDAIEPYDYSELKPFSNAYLPGFLADKYDVKPEDCYARVDLRAQNTAEELLSGTVSGYASCTPESRQISVRRSRTSYALLPVWLLATNYDGKNYLFAMNGQTGKLIGDLPVSKGKMLAWFAGIALPLMALLTALLY